MKKNIILLLLLLIVRSLSFGQVKDLSINLGVHPWKANNSLLDSVLKKYDLNDSVYYHIPVTIWIYPTRKGFGPGYNEVKNFMNALNYYFSINHTGINFYLSALKIIPSQRHQNVGYFTENFFMTLSHHIRGTMNIHIVNNLKISTIFYTREIGGTYNSLTKSIIITRSDVPTGIAHEAGHYFGLLHPHRNWNKGKLLAESVSRTRTIGKTKVRNCEARGDYLCDTPAEPDLSLFCNDSCKYTGHITDPWGEPYKPQTDNIMSYQPNKKCRKKFTPYQKAVMLYSVEHSKYAKYWRNTPENISFLTDKNEPDDFIQISTLLESYKPQYHTFNLRFTAKKLLQDKRDFYKYYPLEQKKYYLKLKRGKYLFPPVKITLYDNFYTPILTKYLYDPGQILLPNTSSPVLYIEVENIGQIHYGQLFDYYIELTEF